MFNKKIYLILNIIIVLFFTSSANPSDFSLSRVESEQLHQSHAPNLLPNDWVNVFPEELLLQIGNLSGNTLSLKTTCKKINSTPFITINELFISGYSDSFRAILESMESVSEIPLFSDDIQSLNLYQLTRDNFIKLGLQIVTENESIDSEKVKKFYEAINVGRVYPVMNILVRKAIEGGLGSNWQAIHPQAVTILNELKLKATFYKTDNNIEIDTLFTRINFNEHDFKTFLKFMGGAWDIKDVFQEPEDYPDFGNDIDYIVNMSNENLLRTLQTYEKMTSDYGAFHLSNALDKKCFIEGISLLGNNPDALNTVKDIHAMQLCFGEWLFGLTVEGVKKKRLY